MRTPAASLRCDLLVVAAHGPELEPFDRWLRVTKAAAGRSIGAVGVGVGLPAATAGTAIRVAKLRPRAVLLIGTCGAYTRPSGGLRIGDVAVVRVARLVSLAALQGYAEFPGPVRLSLETHAGLRDGLAEGGPTVDVATTLGVTVDDAMAARIAHATGCAVEHLEALGVATACAEAQLPFAAVLGVANLVGAMGRAQWLAHQKTATEAATARVVAWLERGARGL